MPWRQHGFNTSALQEDSTAMFTCTAVFPGLEKEWRKILSKLGASIDKILTFQSRTTKEVLEGGAPSVKLLCRKGDKLPQWIQIAKMRWKCFLKLLCRKGDKLPQWIQIAKMRWKCFSKKFRKLYIMVYQINVTGVRK